MLRSQRAERGAGLFVVAAIFISACVAGAEAVSRLIHPTAPSHLGALAAAGAIGYLANYVAAQVRTRAGRHLDSPALIADGNHARADAYVSLAVIASAAVVAIGLPIADPLIGLVITLIILRITWQSWRTVRGHHAHVDENARIAAPEARRHAVTLDSTCRSGSASTASARQLGKPRYTAFNRLERLAPEGPVQPRSVVVNGHAYWPLVLCVICVGVTAGPSRRRRARRLRGRDRERG